MTSQPDIFTTLRYIPSDKSLTPSKSDIPLFELHIQRLKRGLAYFGLKLTTATDDLDWEHEVWSALERVIAEKGIDKGLRLKVTVAVNSPPSFKAEAWALPASFSHDLPSSSSSRSSSLPRVTVSPSPLRFQPDDVPLLTFKTSDRRIYDQHTAVALSAHPSTQSTLLHTSRPESLVTETTIANLLFLPTSSSTWITPRITSGTPLLPGLMRQDLLARGLVEEQDITLSEVKEWLKEGGEGRVCCCNALRGIWEVRVEFGGLSES